MDDKSSTGEKKAKRRVVTKEITKTSSPRKEEVLRPSDIRYSQCSVSNKFTNGSLIGELLDDIVAGKCFTQSVKQIEVARVNGKWYSNDNRRLCVFKQLEHLGRLEKIRVKVVEKIPACKFTTKNEGTSVEIRGGSPGGTNFLVTASKRKRTRSKRKRSKTNTKLAGSSAGERGPSPHDTVEGMTIPSSSLKQEVALETSNLPPDDAEWEPLDDILASIDDPSLNDCYFEVYHYDMKETSGKHAPCDVDWFDYFDEAHDCEDTSIAPASSPVDTVNTDQCDKDFGNELTFDDNITDFVSYTAISHAKESIDPSDTEEWVYGHNAESCTFSTNVGSNANPDIKKLVLEKAPRKVRVSRLPQRLMQSDWTDILSNDVDGPKMPLVIRQVPDGTDVDNVFITENTSCFDDCPFSTKRYSSPSVRNEKQQTNVKSTGLTSASDIGHNVDESDAGICDLL